MTVGEGKCVTIVGAGLAGSLLACYLAKLGFRVAIYERRSDPRAAGYVGGRLINLALSARGLWGLAGIGLEKDVLAHARVVLAKGCPLDLHGSAFKPPQSAQTLLAKSQVILQCVDARPVFRLFVRLSFANYIAEWLLDAAAELAASRTIDTQRISNRLA